MTHLSPAEFVDAAERVLPSARAAHLDACVACREQAVVVASALVDARSDEAPEPSPLYWEHLSARVRERVAGERIVPAWRASLGETFSVRHLVPVASAVALFGAVLISGLMTRTGHVSAPVEPVPVVASSVDPGVQSDDSEAWDMLTAAAAETRIEDAHAAGLGVPAGAIDRAVLRMSPDELNALGRLLQDELHRSGN